ncbi:replication initiator [Streptomyces sp. NPDC017202]|uniref:replication initiator n=1 Tax=Streptomyces sp. NPDC017202 TaxID=3364981 RepID=UPI00378AD5B3
MAYAEYRQRGLVHFHAVVRFDGPGGHTTLSPAWASFDALRVIVGPAVERARLTLESDSVGERVIRRGDLSKVDRISAPGDGELTDAKVAGYVAKYATKNTLDAPAHGAWRGVSTPSR